MSKEIHRRDFLKVIPGGVATLFSVHSGVATANSIPSAQPGPLRWNLSEYRETPGLTAEVANDVLTLTWEGDRDEELKLRMSINAGTPTIQDLSVRHGKKDASWITLASNITPEFRVVSGYRRMTEQQMQPLHDMGMEITPAIIAQDKWNAFWDAPLMVPGNEKGGLPGDRPPVQSVGGQPGLPRRAEEINRATAVYQAQSCEVKTNGARLEITFPGVQLGAVFSGRLQYTVYKGISLIRQEVIAKTEMPSVAYKYDAGLKGLAIQPTSRVVWRDLNGQWVSNEFGGPIDAAPVVLRSANRVAAAELPGGSIAAFPPPHNFFWQSELAINLGNSWFSKDSGSSFAFGVRQAESQEDPAYAGRGGVDTREDWALRNARPGTWQRMPVYFYVGSGPGQETIQSALAFTRGDHYKPLSKYKVMVTHFHSDSVPRLLELGGLNATLPDYDIARAAGINIFAPVDAASGPGAKGDTKEAIVAALVAGGHAQNLALAYEAARLHSDKDFVVMPNEEIGFGRYAGLDIAMGGHNDLLISHPIYWNPGRAPGQPLVEEDPKYGKVYHIGSPEDLMEMTHREDLLIYMPHPRAKGSTGLPDAIKDTAHFRDENWRGIGFRWGIGVDGSEVRLSDYRCQPLFDDMNNWVADLPTPPKYIHVISEFDAIGYEDDFYANNPVDYIRIDELPGPDDWSPIIHAMKSGNYFTTSGEVLIPSYAVEGTGNQRRIVADVEWTFPLDFAEVVWGDGKKTDRQIISATDLPAFGTHHFQIPFDATGKKWVRFAVWDSAGNGAMVQPIKLIGSPTDSESASR